jgi:hypothetical protein
VEKVTEAVEDSKDSKLSKDELIQATVPTWSPDTEPVWAACRWMMLQAEQKYVSEQFARQRVSAIKSLFLDTDPDTITVTQFYERLSSEVFHTQWINSREHQGLANRKTLKTYLGRASFTLAEYIDRSSSGHKYDITRLTRYTDPNRPSSPKKPLGSEVPKPRSRALPVAVPSLPAAPPEQEGFEFRIQVGARGSACIRLDFDPADLTIEDVGKITAQLAGRTSFSTHDAGKLGARLAADATNFDPMRAVVEQMFPLAPA